MITKQEEEHFEADGTMKKIDDDCEEDTKEEMHDEECDNEHYSESETKGDRDFTFNALCVPFEMRIE